MMWRWEYATVKIENQQWKARGYKVAGDDRTERRNTGRGYCGLASQPEVK
jgi:hypothetical protein